MLHLCLQHVSFEDHFLQQTLLSCHPLGAVVAGRLLCDTYLCARDLVHEVDYTLTTLARNLLNQERAELNSSDIPGGYSNLLSCLVCS